MTNTCCKCIANVENDVGNDQLSLDIMMSTKCAGTGRKAICEH
jgi:hypothetical protein